MARFSSGDDHASRRRSVEVALESVAQVDLVAIAKAETRPLLGAPIIDAVGAIGFVVPTRTLGTALGVVPHDLDQLTADVRSIVEVIGRGATATRAADDATTRLRTRFADHPGGADAVISLLYQNHDATAALFASRLLAGGDANRRGALPKTVRFVAGDVDLAGQRFEVGTTIELSLDDPALEFGAGVHRCAGSDVAGAIVDGMIQALDGWMIVRDDIEHDAEGRPRRLPITST